jgi:hypothetical protein
MDIFAKISLFSSIGIISSGIGIGTLSGSEKRNFLPESRALYNKMKEIEEGLGTALASNAPPKVKGTEIHIGGLSYLINSKLTKNKRTTTIIPRLFDQNSLKTLLKGEEFKKDKKDFGTKTPGIDQKLNQLIINSNKAIAEDDTFSPDARAAAIERLDAFYVLPNLPEEEKDVIQSFIEGMYIEVDSSLRQKSSIQESSIQEQTDLIKILGKFYTLHTLSEGKKEAIQSFIEGTRIEAEEKLQSDSSLNEKIDIMKQLAALYVSPATSSETKDKIKKFIIAQALDLTIKYNIIRFFMDEEMETKFKKIIEDGEIQKEVFWVSSEGMLKAIGSYPPLSTAYDEGTGLGNAKYYKATDPDYKNMLILLSSFFNDPSENPCDAMDKLKQEIEKELQEIGQTILLKDKLEQEEHDNFEKKLESYRSRVQEIIEQLNPLYNKSLIMNQFPSDILLKMFNEGEKGAIAGVIGIAVLSKNDYEKLSKKIEAALATLQAKEIKPPEIVDLAEKPLPEQPTEGPTTRRDRLDRRKPLKGPEDSRKAEDRSTQGQHSSKQPTGSSTTHGDRSTREQPPTEHQAGRSAAHGDRSTREQQSAGHSTGSSTTRRSSSARRQPSSRHTTESTEDSRKAGDRSAREQPTEQPPESSKDRSAQGQHSTGHQAGSSAAHGDRSTREQPPTGQPSEGPTARRDNSARGQPTEQPPEGSAAHRGRSAREQPTGHQAGGSAAHGSSSAQGQHSTGHQAGSSTTRRDRSTRGQPTEQPTESSKDRSAREQPTEQPTGSSAANRDRSTRDNLLKDI